MKCFRFAVIVCLLVLSTPDLLHAQREVLHNRDMSALAFKDARTNDASGNMKGERAQENLSLPQLRNDFAMRYLEPSPHFALARYYFNRGDKLQAFYLLEAARRGRFEESVFNKAFDKWFVEPKLNAKPQRNAAIETEKENYRKRIADSVEGNIAKTKALIAEATTKFPAEGDFLFGLGIVYEREDNLQQAETMYKKAAEASPDSEHIQTWTGRFFFKVKQDNAQALKYYLNAYLLSPHAYETEFVESRIRKINWEAATLRFQQMTQERQPIEEILQDLNPTVVVIALEDASEKKWQPSYTAAVTRALAHDDESVRWAAMTALAKNVDRSFDVQLQTLLNEKDLRQRGMACYIAVRLWKEKSFPLMRQMLQEESQLLRYDAISALVLEGGSAGRKVALEHESRETNPTLKEILKVARKEGASGAKSESREQ